MSPSAPTASPYSCSDKRNTVVAGKLQAEVALWHKNDLAWRETRPWIVPSNPFPWPQYDGPRVVEPPWMRACDVKWADGTALATPSYLAARCLDAFRAALRQWFYGEPDEMATDALPRAPLSREPCTGASVERVSNLLPEHIVLFCYCATRCCSAHAHCCCWQVLVPVGHESHRIPNPPSVPTIRGAASNA